jgi:hypothetical protein
MKAFIKINRIGWIENTRFYTPVLISVDQIQCVTDTILTRKIPIVNEDNAVECSLMKIVDLEPIHVRESTSQIAHMIETGEDSPLGFTESIPLPESEKDA